MVLVSCLGFSTAASADSPTGWDPRVLPTGTYREQISRTPIPQRPGRPLHIYGNAVRIIHQRTQTPIIYRPISRFLLGTDRLRPGR